MSGETKIPLSGRDEYMATKRVDIVLDMIVNNRVIIRSKVWTKIGEGGFGSIYSNPEKTRALKLFGYYNETRVMNEIYMMMRMGDADIGPEVYTWGECGYSRKYVIMKRYQTDARAKLEDIKRHLEEKCNFQGTYDEDTFVIFNQDTKDTMDGITHSISILIDKIGDFYAANPDLPLCFADFRFKNIVLEESKYEFDVFEARQIDFDLCIRDWREEWTDVQKTQFNSQGWPQDWNAEHIKRIFKLRLALTAPLPSLFEHSVIFGDDILVHEAAYKECFKIIKKIAFWNRGIDMYKLTHMQKMISCEQTDNNLSSDWENFTRHIQEGLGTHKGWYIIKNGKVVQSDRPAKRQKTGNLRF